ncbi:AEC family transporter [Hydrocarboniclastica marina]|uniref:AEC family transporter n=1 Tax=Hydrocarboniclastica marina TaxID=2259620 RepID=A0A4V1D8Z2_9ALTE|nr:AEC family transporter [Hydrocarboniclastica marina]QCF26880.1 AEC family transporter [Hydrocarboniclastica marina]
MDTVFPLLLKMLPLYATVALGWVAARYLDVSGRNIANLMLYILTPSVIFGGVIIAPLSAGVLMLPLLVWLACAVIGQIFLRTGHRWLGDERANILSLATCTGNTGYFGIPVALLLFGQEGMSIYIICMLGTTLYENSLGFYIAARGRFPARECFQRVLRLPSVYAFLVAAALNLMELGIPGFMQPLFDNLRGAYSVLGMMIIGMGIGSIGGWIGDRRFTALAFTGKFLAWPALVAFAWAIDTAGPGIYDPQIYRSLFLMSIMPIAANTVVFATLLELHPRQTAGTTLLSTMFALVYIPIMAALVL